MAILTISREFGSGGMEIGRKTASLMEYEFVDREKILADLKSAGAKWEEWAKELDEHNPTVWERYDWSFRGFAALIQSKILDYALKDRVVIMGRGANFLLKGIPSAFRVRVIAPVDVRIERIVKREQVGRDTARWLVEKTDRERAGFIHSIYGKRWDDVSEYDAVFEVADQPLDDIVQALKGALAEREQRNTEEVRNALAMRAAAARVKAGIATNPAFFVPVLDVEAEKDGIVLRGVVHGAREHKRIEEEAKKLAGALPIRCELHYRS